MLPHVVSVDQGGKLQQQGIECFIQCNHEWEVQEDILYWNC